jgi:hypothetical protein
LLAAYGPNEFCDLVAWPRFRLLATNLIGQAGTTTYTDTGAAGLSPLFYRVGAGVCIAPTNPPQPTLTWRDNPSAGTLTFTWSGTGFRLQAQTNRSEGGLSTNWFDYPEGTASPVTVPVDPTSRSSFYRLVWP